MLRLAGASLRRQIVLLSILASSTALLLACAAFVVFEVITFRAAMVQSLATHAQVIAANTKAPVLFQDARAANETLSALRAEPAIMYVELLLPDGRPFARYLRSDLVAPPERASLPAGVLHRFERNALVLTHDVVSDGVTIARLYLQSDLRQQQARIRRYLTITGFILVVSLVAGFAMSARLQRRISEPILGLVAAARTVSDQKDFSVRASTLAAGEVGLLGKTFNEMLATLQSQDADLRRAVAARDEFLSIASHELKTPLTPLQLQVQKLQLTARRHGDDPLAQKIASGLDVMDRQVVRLTTLVNTLLDISRITSQQLRLEPEEMDLSALVREVVTRSAQELRRAGCELHLSADTPAMGFWDRSRLDQVITNLLSNAIKYGAGKPIEISVVGRDDRVQLGVRDHGIGIAQQDQDRIFGRFERAVSLNSYGGLGLGLWIVRQIVEASGGTISVESQPGQGALFTVDLPRRATGGPS
jgi:signal transduction histidine kinase